VCNNGKTIRNGEDNFMKKYYFIAYILALIIVLMSACGKKIDQQNQSTISVSGIGTVLVQPDVIQMNITLSNVAQTTKMAQEAVSQMVRQVLIILKNAGVEDKNITTASLTFSSEYEYVTRRILIGQKAEQGIAFSIDNIIEDSEKASKIIDQLIGINGIELNRINFSVKNNTEYFIRSRELAFEKAVEKANQYADLSKLKIKKVLSISEEGNQLFSPIHNRLMNNRLAANDEADFYGSTVVPTGELEITTRILVVFLLE
jgi:uncharacterized protein YggE